MNKFTRLCTALIIGATIGFLGFATNAQAVQKRYTVARYKYGSGGNQYFIRYNPSVGKFTFSTTPTYWVIVPDGAGFRLKVDNADICLNAGNFASGCPLLVYTCVKGDAGQIFQPTPDPGQLKFNALNMCVSSPNALNPYEGAVAQIQICTTGLQTYQQEFDEIFEKYTYQDYGSKG
jgi:hypothetical protein